MWPSLCLCFIKGIAKIQFIRSQKKNAQLVHDGFIFNKKIGQANGHVTWRCSDLSKNRCRAVCITKYNVLISTRRGHDHDNHWGRIANRTMYPREDDMDEYETVEARPVASAIIGYKSLYEDDDT